MKKILALLLCLNFSFVSEAFSYGSSSIERYVYTQLSQGNTDVALKFLKQLEDLRNPEGITLLGIIYLEGHTDIKDMRLANYYFSKAAALDFAPAIKALADSYMAGDGVERNKVVAFQFYEKAAKFGYGPAQFNAGIMLKNGEGTQLSLNRAYQMLDLAAHNPDLGEISQDAAFYRDQVKEQMVSALKTKNFQTCFPSIHNCLSVVIDAINKAEKSIQLQAYSFTSEDVSKALIAAHQRGVKVIILTSKNPKTYAHTKLQDLDRKNIEIFFDTDLPVSHSKILIIDNELVMTGSYHFSNEEEQQNAENLIVVTDKEIAEQYSRELDRRLAISSRN